MSEIVFVGTSDAFGGGGRRQSAYLVRGPSGGVLLDCGQTTGTGLGALGIPLAEVDTIVVSHFHADHFGGIPLFLLASLYREGRVKPVVIAGPPDIEKRVRAAARALGHAIEDHEWTFPIHFQELPAGSEHELGPVRVRTFATNHSPEAHPHGMIVHAGEKKIAYSGDTGWFDGLPALVNGSDLFLCECTQVQRGFEYHLSLEELTENRERFDTGHLVLTHLGEAMRSQVHHNGFSVADDGLVIKL